MEKKRLFLLVGLLSVMSNFSYADPSSSKDTDTKNISLAAPPTTAAASPITGNFDMTTNYVYRGVSNTNNNPAIQGGFTYTSASTGIYFNLWGSNVNFLDPQGKNATVEIDTILGISHDIFEDLSYDINISRYNYPRASAANYDELIMAFTYKIFTATMGYSTDVYGSHKKGTYYNGALNYDLNPKYTLNFNDITAMASVGHYVLPSSAGLLSYTDYMLGIKKKLGQYTFILQWTGTNGESHQSPLDNNFVLATVQVDF